MILYEIFKINFELSIKLNLYNLIYNNIIYIEIYDIFSYFCERNKPSSTN